MTLSAIKIKNLLSFENLSINSIKDINCIVGTNNAGKSNLLKLLRFFYDKLEGKKTVPPSLYSRYSPYGEIKLTFDLDRLQRITCSPKNANNNYFNYLERIFFNPFSTSRTITNKYSIKLKINSDDSVNFSENNSERLSNLLYLFPFFEIETRHIDLYNWNKLWNVASRLKSFSAKSVNNKEVKKFLDEKLSNDESGFIHFIDSLEDIIETSEYSYNEKILTYIKAGLKGDSFNIDGESLNSQSDGTNSHKYVDIFLKFLITLTRKEFITPIVFLDEPETGLHPKRNEELISEMYRTYSRFKKTKNERELRKYSTPYPSIFIATHSPNIVKQVIKLFSHNHQVLHFSKEKRRATQCNVMNSNYPDNKFINVFNDNEARLFFSKFILFVEGQSEIEIFGNKNLAYKFPHLLDVDIYATSSDISHKYINPAYANTSIPYLTLIDSDQILSFSIRKMKFSLENKSEIDIKSLKKKYSFNYFSREKNENRKSLDNFVNATKKKYKISPNAITYLDFDLKKYIENANKGFLSEANHYVCTTTIEGAVINPESFKFFWKWLIQVIKENFQIKERKCPAKFLLSKRIELSMRPNAILAICCKTLEYSFQKHNVQISASDLKFLRYLKAKYFLEIKNLIRKNNRPYIEQVILVKMLVGGKSDTLVASHNKNFGDLNSNFKSDLKELVELTKPFGGFFQKRGGWATSFLDFNIANLSHLGEKQFSKHFGIAFPELVDIIDRLRPR